MYSYFNECILVEVKNAYGCAGFMEKPQKGENSGWPLGWQVTVLFTPAGGRICTLASVATSEVKISHSAPPCWPLSWVPKSIFSEGFYLEDPLSTTKPMCWKQNSVSRLKACLSPVSHPKEGHQHKPSHSRQKPGSASWPSPSVSFPSCLLHIPQAL